jgi:hypothetical protein
VCRRGLRRDQDDEPCTGDHSGEFPDDPHT